MVTKDKLVKLLASDEITHRDKLIFILGSAKGKHMPTAEVLKIAKALGLNEIVKWNVYDILIKSKSLVTKVNAGWKLTSQGRAYVSQEVFQLRIPSRTSVGKK